MKVSSVNALTGIPIKELNRLNRDSWFHGTSLKNVENLTTLGVKAMYNIGNMLDFGPGFYLTDTKKRAESYISRVPVIFKDGHMNTRTSWAIVEYEFNPYRLLFGDPQEDQNEINTLYQFRNFASHNTEFAKFVFMNRFNNVHNESPHGIDIIWGVMSDSFPDELIQNFRNNIMTYEEVIKRLQKTNSMKQLYIGNQKICDMLQLKEIYTHE